MNKQRQRKQGRRILIVGGPRCGKTTRAKELAAELGIDAEHFDDLIGTGDWSEISERIAKTLDDKKPWIREGVAGVRALRKWLAANPGKLPDFEVQVLNEPRVAHTKGQAAMHKGHDKILRECLDTIEHRKGIETSALSAVESE